MKIFQKQQLEPLLNYNGQVWIYGEPPEYSSCIDHIIACKLFHPKV